jgi:SH3-like domain-containing protein
LLLAVGLLFAACGRSRGKHAEVAYVSAPQAVLRDRVAAVYTKTGAVKNGERVRVLERDRRFVRVRTEGGEEGWIEQRYLVTQQVFDAFEKLTRAEQNDPPQGTGTTRNQTNMHLEPARDAEHLFQLDRGAKVAILKRATTEKVLPGARARPEVQEGEPAPKPILEDWWLTRDSSGHVGWVLARMLDLDVPLAVAQYAEGQRIVAFFVLDYVNDGGKEVPQYLVLLTAPKDGMPFDYNQVRVFTWNARRHRYETAYRQHNLDGVLPVTVTQENFDKEGTLPVFVLRVKDEKGNISERKYKLNTPIVRRVLTRGEQ